MPISTSEALAAAQLAEELVTALIGLVGPAKARELIDQQAVDAANYAADLLEANLKDN